MTSARLWVRSGGVVASAESPGLRRRIGGGGVCSKGPEVPAVPAVSAEVTVHPSSSRRGGRFRSELDVILNRRGDVFLSSRGIPLV